MDEQVTRECGWCGTDFSVPARQVGRPRRFCKRSCRQRSYESAQVRVTLKSVLELVDRVGSQCYICGVGLTVGVDLELDHVVPLSQGGPDSLSNVRPCCRRCNLEKGASIKFVPVEWIGVPEGVS
jgi:5-methylcytosine-specific restriction endonuclease McrA